MSNICRKSEVEMQFINCLGGHLCVPDATRGTGIFRQSPSISSIPRTPVAHTHTRFDCIAFGFHGSNQLTKRNAWEGEPGRAFAFGVNSARQISVPRGLAFWTGNIWTHRNGVPRLHWPHCTALSCRFPTAVPDALN